MTASDPLVRSARTPISGQFVTPLLFVLLYLIWGFTYVALKIGLLWTGPLTMAGLRSLLAGMALGGVALAMRRPLPVDRRVHGRIAIVGLLNVAGLAGLMSVGLTAVSAGESSLLIYTQPLQVAALSAVLLGERLSRRQLAGVAVGFLGMTVVLAPRLHSSAGPVWWAYAALLLGAFCWALSSVLYRSWQSGSTRFAQADIVWLTGLQALYGSVPLVVAAMVVEGLAVTPSVDLLWTLVYTGLLASGVANLLWFFLLSRQSATVVATYVFLVPAFAVAFGALVLNEPVTPTLVLGGLLTLVGIGLVSRR